MGEGERFGVNNVLSTVIFPESLREGTESLYFRGDEVSVEHGMLTITEGNVLSLDTYFNSFSYDNYVKYTKIEEIIIEYSLNGKALVEVFCQTVEESKLLFVEERERSGKSEIPIKIRELPSQGILWIRVTARKCAVILQECAFTTKAKGERCPRLAVVICTYQRESYVKRNLEKLSTEIFEVGNPQKEQLKVLVIDNGQTLNLPQMEGIQVIPNKNYGGSGGFARGMLEASESIEDFTHVLLMDDDISFEVESILRVLHFLSYEKESEKPCIFGGHMLIEEEPTIQFEGGGRYEKGRLKALHQNLDVSLMENLLDNQVDEPCTQYQAWWFCCIPMKTIRQVGFPLPFFIKTDDVEYGLRCASPIILMNGVGVWHCSFASKQSPHLEYYIKRNELIVSSLYDGQKAMFYSLLKLAKASCKGIFFLKWDYMSYIILAYEDFMKGPEYLYYLEADEFHKVLLKKTSNRKKNFFIVIKSILKFFTLSIHFSVQYKKNQIHYNKCYDKLKSIEIWKKLYEK